MEGVSPSIPKRTSDLDLHSNILSFDINQGVVDVSLLLSPQTQCKYDYLSHTSTQTLRLNPGRQKIPLPHRRNQAPG
jgi:hypothetical protein